MERNKICLLVGVAVLALTTAGCQKSAEEELGAGTFEGSSYRNEYLGMTIELPTDWNIPEREAFEQVMEVGKQMVVGDDQNMQAVIEATESQSAQLFSASRHPLGAPVEFNQNIIAVAEQVSHMPGIKAGKDYLFHTKKLFQSGQMDFSFPEEIRREVIGGAEFDVMPVEMNVMGQQIKQDYYATIRKGYALLFGLAYTTGEQRSELEGILQTVTLSPM